jgi:Zinc dependent phospholipase C
MPTSATHITVLERVAISNSAMTNLLGDPLMPDDLQIKYAKLGSLGPDIFYAMADYGRDLQDLENFLIKVAGTFDCIGELMGEVGRYVDGIESVITFGISDSMQQTFNLIKAAINEGVLALIVGPAGVNLWPIFEAARQQDKPRENWFWADYLHYIKSGKFVDALIKNAKASGNDKLVAYAYGYLTHYVTDVLGHPYVNQVVQGPWRLYWQRHHLVENFMDTYVWDRWHVSNPPPAPPSTSEQPLDTLVNIPNIAGMGSPVTFSRLNDHINVGGTSLGDSVDDLVKKVCDKIEKGLFDIGIAEDISPDKPTDAVFKDWCKLMETTLKQVYNNTGRFPENLNSDVDITKNPNKGYPTTDDIAAAYGTFRLVLRMATEEKIKEPMPPDIIGDITAAVDQLANDLANNLSGFPPPPSISTSGSFSWDSLWDAIKKIAEWIGETLEAVGKTVFDFIKDSINTFGTALSEPIKYALYLLNKALFSIYNSFRDVLVYAAYAIPYTNKLSVDIGGGNNSSSLWRSPGNLFKNLYPVEEIGEERKMIFSNYAPFVPPVKQSDSQKGQGELFLEHPNFSFTAPYQPSPGMTLTPDIFLDLPLGPDDMFSTAGPQQITTSVIDPNYLVGSVLVPAITLKEKNFGGSVANCIRGIELSEAGFPMDALLPDYNLDGDRSYAWPCWDITDPVPIPATGDTTGNTKTPLAPEPMITVTHPLNVPDYSTNEAIVSVIPVNN